MEQSMARGGNSLGLDPSQGPLVVVMGFSVANGTNKSVYEIFAENPERARRFGNAVRPFTEGTGFELSHVVNSYPSVDHASGRMVDVSWKALIVSPRTSANHLEQVGGSQGFVSIALARHFPTMEFVVQEFAARRRIGQERYSGRPRQGADVYFFRWILHNWADKYCTRILRNRIPSLKKGAKLVINDNVLPEPGIISNWQENRLR
ncbi:uncharacterized protein PG986_001086 [Apiospora aurea]|uniref:O-methyltransferase C-terminal domain-containing protein n=1 Tax=Apiospora aurea TaxID=335848 RepID=A0ABR1QW15_9PEZI